MEKGEDAVGVVFSRMGRVLLALLYLAGLLAGGFLLLCRLGVLSPAEVAEMVSPLLWVSPG